MEFGSKNKIVWIMGGMASGKSTLRRALCYCLGGEKRIDDELHITEYGDDVVCIGACKTGIEDNFGFDSLDSSFGKLKKDGALSVTEYCIKKYKVTILEGSQTSGKWVEPMIDMCERNDVELYIVLLNMSYYNNILRLKKRHLNSGKTVDSISDNAIQSVIGKINQFRGAYEKAMQINSICKHQITLDVANMKVEEEVVSVSQFMSLI